MPKFPPPKSVTRITHKLLRAHGACWSDYKIKKVLPQHGATIRQIMMCEEVPKGDRLWVACIPGILTTEQHFEILNYIVENFFSEEEKKQMRKLLKLKTIKARKALKNSIVWSVPYQSPYYYRVFDLVDALYGHTPHQASYLYRVTGLSWLDDYNEREWAQRAVFRFIRELVTRPKKRDRKSISHR
jgi:hypothetical protein